jgi:hypothetical protein
VEESPANAEPSLPFAWARWASWRGSPELIGRIGRAAIEAVQNRTGQSPQCRIAVAVDGDTEVFASPAEFNSEVSPEALRRLRSVVIRAEAAGVVVSAEFSRPPTSWGKPAAPAGVIVRADDGAHQDEAAMRAMVEELRPVVDRGRDRLGAEPAIGFGTQPTSPKERRVHQVVDLALTWFVVMAFAAAAVFVYVALPFPSDDVPGLVLDAVAAVGLALAVPLMGWFRPPVEVASPGQTRLARTVLWLVGALAASGLGLGLDRILGDS